MNIYTTLAATWSLCAASLAQTAPPLQARNFHFDEYRTVIRLDMKAIRDTGVWDELLAGGAKVVSQLVRDELGFDLDVLDRLSTTRRAVEGRAMSDHVLVMEYNADVGVPPAYGSDRYRVSAVGPYTLHVDSRGHESMVMPSARMLVVGGEQRLREILGGKPRAGLPSADVMSLTAGKQGTLAEFVVDLAQDPWLMKDIEGALQDVNAAQGVNAAIAWPEGASPELVSGRVSAVGDEDDPHLLLEVVFRHGAASSGLEVTERAVAAGIAALKKTPEARMFWPLLNKVEYKRSVTDGIWRVDLGRARSFGGIAATAAPLILAWLKFNELFEQLEVGVLPGAALQVLEDEVEEPPPPPPPPPVEAGGGR
ncbi:MAG: hypothetical protein VXY92_09325 [Planctomycetota bacterium]|nr:hypothetical protein [Planctomycetota bacterium]